MKKLFALLVVAGMLTFAACSQKAEEGAAQGEQPATEQPATTEEAPADQAAAPEAAPAAEDTAAAPAPEQAPAQ